MIPKQTLTVRLSAAAGLLLAACAAASAQVAPTPANAKAPADSNANDELVELSPFVVSASDADSGYSVKDTLAGARVRTDLRDVASSISVINAQFLKDTGARNSKDLLVYTTGTEVAGLNGNFSGQKSTYLGGFVQSDFSGNPNTETRVRGLDSADNTRDYFISDIPWDAYNVGRVDLQRGPNSILFGVGSPAGIVNTSLNAAVNNDNGKVEGRFGSFGSVRGSLDVNQVLLPDQLSIRVAGLDDDTKYQQKPAYNRDRRVFAAVRYSPAFLKSDWASTTFKVNFEQGKVDANRPRYMPPEDHITPFFATTDAYGDAINRQTYDPLVLWQSGYAGITGSSNTGTNINYWIGQYKGPTMQTTNNAVALYPTARSSTVSSYSQALPYGEYLPTNTGWGVPYFAAMGIVGLQDYAKNAHLPGADAGTWKTKSLSDPTIFDFYNKLIDGPNKKEWQKWTAFNFALDEVFFHNRLAFQVAYDRQDYTQGQERNLANPFISVDIDKYNGTSPVWDPKATVNPYAGYAFVGSGTRDNGGSSTDTRRETFRATVTADLRAEDIFDKKSTLAEIFGHHVITGLFDNNVVTTRNLSWTRYAFGTDYTNAIGLSGKGNLTDGGRVLDWITYLGNVSNATTASGLHLDNISAVQSPGGTATVNYWNPTYTSALSATDTTWTNPYSSYTWTVATGALKGSWVPSAKTVANYNNPANYAGWTNAQFNILNADQGDRNSLYTTASKLRTKIESGAITYQGFFFDDTIVATWGFRRDKVTNNSGYGTTDATSGSVLNYNTMTYNSAYDDTNTANNISWGLVSHLPKALRAQLPLDTDISLHYDRGQNVRSEIRYGFSGNRLPNASGNTEEYGFTIDTLNDKVQFKMTWYDTKVKNANMADTTGQNGTLGSNTYELYMLPTWGTVHALTARAGLAGQLTTYDANGAVVSNSASWAWDWVGNSGSNATWLWKSNNDPLSAAYKADPGVKAEQAAVDDWFKYMNMGQTWYDNYGYKFSSSAWAASDWANIIPGNDVSSPNVGGLQSSGGGRIRGTFPIGTIDNESKGVELEVTAQPF